MENMYSRPLRTTNSMGCVAAGEAHWCNRYKYIFIFDEHKVSCGPMGRKRNDLSVRRIPSYAHV